MVCVRVCETPDLKSTIGFQYIVDEFNGNATEVVNPLISDAVPEFTDSRLNYLDREDNWNYEG